VSSTKLLMYQSCVRYRVVHFGNAVTVSAR